MQCPECQHENVAGRAYCTGCGRKLSDDPHKTRQNPRPAPPIFQNRQGTPGKRRNCWIWVVVGLAVVSLGGALGYYYFYPDYLCRKAEQEILEADKEGHLVRRQPVNSNSVKDGDGTAYDLFKKSEKILCDEAKMRIAAALSPKLDDYGSKIFRRPGNNQVVDAQEWLEAERIYKWLPQLRWKELDKTKIVWKARQQIAQGQYEARKEKPDFDLSIKALNEAIELLKKEKRTEADLAKAYFGRGKVHKLRGEVEKNKDSLALASADFENAFRNDQNLIQACYDNAWVCQGEKCMGPCMDAVISAPKKSQTLYIKAIYLSKTGQCLEAYNAFREAADLQRKSGSNAKDAEAGMEEQVSKFLRGKCKDGGEY